MIGYFIIIGVFSVVGMIIQSKLKSKFKKYSRMGLANDMSGKEVAEAMLSHFGISDVTITMGKGFLTDHYNPVNKTVTLSPAVYQGRNIASAAVAAHECGHAVQHAKAYSMLKVRSALVPVVQVAASAQQYLLLGALLFFGSFPQLMFLVIIAFAITTLFSFVTLPVEFDASRRALAWLDQSGVTHGKEYDGAKDALWWAAMTYVVAALTSLIILLFFILRFAGGD